MTSFIAACKEKTACYIIFMQKEVVNLVQVVVALSFNLSLKKMFMLNEVQLELIRQTF